MENTKPGCLDGVTVLDFTWVLAGPHATKTLADMGANIIKVEQYKSGANERWLPYHVIHDGVIQSSYAINVNRGKKSICVNLKNPKGMAVVHELIGKSDVVIENFAPGVMDRLGLDYESVRKIKDDIIYCSISCFGHWGPYSHKPGYDIIAQSASGWTSQSDPPIIAPVSIGDTVASMHACTAILGALYAKQASGVGQNIDISMMDCLFSLHENSLPWYLIGQAVGSYVELPPVGRQHPGYAPYGIYKGKNGGLICIACLTDSRWAPLVKLMGEKYAWLLTDPRAKDVSTRCTTDNAPLVHQALEEWIMEQDSVEDVERMLDEADIPCLRVRGIRELAETDPQIKARDMMSVVDQPFIGPMKMYGSPLKMSETPSCIRGHAPILGEHNAEVLTDILGYREKQIAALYEDDVLYHEPAVDRLKNGDGNS